MDIFNDVRMRMEADMERGTRSRINARDAFQQEDMGYVRECYNRGWQLKKDKQIDSYRILNAGKDKPVFEVRVRVNGRNVWRAPPAPTGTTPLAPTPPRSNRLARPEGQNQGASRDRDWEMEEDNMEEGRRPPPPTTIQEVIDAATAAAAAGNVS
jgi:hypothetical protein